MAWWPADEDDMRKIGGSRGNEQPAKTGFFSSFLWIAKQVFQGEFPFLFFHLYYLLYHNSRLQEFSGKNSPDHGNLISKKKNQMRGQWNSSGNCLNSRAWCKMTNLELVKNFMFNFYDDDSSNEIVPADTNNYRRGKDRESNGFRECFVANQSIFHNYHSRQFSHRFLNQCQCNLLRRLCSLFMNFLRNLAENLRPTDWIYESDR